MPADPASRAKRFELADARFHRLGDDPKRDAVVRPPTPGQTGGVYITLDPSGHWLVATISRSFTKEFKAEAVQLVCAVKKAGKSAGVVAKELGLTETSLRGWVRQADIDGGRGPEGALTTAEKEELSALRKEVRVLRMERDLLKKSGGLRVSRARSITIERQLHPR